MGFNDEYLKLRKKREEEDEEIKSSVPYQRPLNTEASRNAYRDKVISGDTDDIAPMPNWTDETNEGDGFFQKGVFDDGYQFGDIAKTILGTAGDLTIGVAKGATNLYEGMSDLLMYGGAGAASLLGNKDFSEELKKEAARSYTDVLFGEGEKFVEDYSILGKTGDSVAEAVGQVLGLAATSGLGAVGKLGSVGQSILTNSILGASVAGSSMTEAYLNDAEDGEAGAYGAMSGAIAVGTEMIFGGMGKVVNALGFSRGLSSLDDVFAKKLSSKMSSTFFKNLTEWGVKSSFEGVEEVLEGLGSAAAKKLTYMSDEELNELVKDENLLESFVVGTVTSGITQSGAIPGMKQGSLIDTTKKGEDFITGLTKSEQAVIDKVYNDRIAEAEGKLWKERPFNLKMDYDPDGSGSPSEVLVQGVIDCWFEEEDGLVLVDYKTSRIRSGSSGPELEKEKKRIASHYQTQIDIYRRALEVTTGKPVKEAYIYLTNCGEVVEL